MCSAILNCPRLLKVRTTLSNTDNHLIKLTNNKDNHYSRHAVITLGRHILTRDVTDHWACYVICRPGDPDWSRSHRLGTRIVICGSWAWPVMRPMDGQGSLTGGRVGMYD